jgi:hypothetical protein
MSKKILCISLVLQIAVLALLLTGIGLNRNSQNGSTFLYTGFTVQIIVLALVVYLVVQKTPSSKDSVGDE